MKVIYLCRALETGGIEQNLLLLVPLLREQGCAVHVASAGGPMRDPIVEAGATHHELSCNLRDPAALARDAATLRRMLDFEQPDVVHVFSAVSGVIFKMAVAGMPRGRRPFHAASVMGLQESPDEKAWVTHLRNYLTIFGADRSYVISPTIGRFLRQLPVRPGRLTELPVVGIEIPELPTEARRAKLRDEVRDDLGIPRDHAVVTTIGYLGPRKSHELFVAAAELVARSHPKTSFLILGEGPARESLQTQIDTAGLSDRILLTGVRRDLDRVLPATDILVKPGVLEGFIGITVLEAQSFRVPVVAFDTIDVRMAIEDGKTGIIVERGNVRGLAQALEDLLDRPDETAELACAGRELVVERFAIEGVAAGLVAAYREQLGR